MFVTDIYKRHRSAYLILYKLTEKFDSSKELLFYAHNKVVVKQLEDAVIYV